ncbi:MAG: phage holin family protein [Opitutaceae bacterium]|nr:phage holin family protein [Opitutaceae bacterium]
MDTPKAPPAPGFMASLRSLGDSALEALQSRLTLFSVEFQEERLRLVQLVIWLTAAIFTGVMALAFASLALAFWLWQSSPLIAVSVLAGVYLLGFAIIAISFKRYLARQPRPFDATIQELERDRTCIRGNN